MASKVLVKLPTVSFAQGKKPPSDVVKLTERNDHLNQVIRHQNINVDRVAQLEQNMKFLQEQHQATLVALHLEVDSLRQKNRDLQFQLVFSKGSACLASSPSSPEESESGFVKPKQVSPVCINSSSLEVELLEKDLRDTKKLLEEAKNQNEHLSEIIEEQRKKLQSIGDDKPIKPSMVDIGIQAVKFDPDRAALISRLKETQGMVKGLYMRNVNQRHEIGRLKAASANTNGNKGGQSRDGNNSHRSRESTSSTAEDQASHKFPPLQSQSYWFRRSHRNGRNRHDRQEEYPHHSDIDSLINTEDLTDSDN